MFLCPGTHVIPVLGVSSYTTPAHIARATLEANAFQTRGILESMKLDSNTDLKHLMVDGGMTNGDMVMKVLADIGGFTVVRPEMREWVLMFLCHKHQTAVTLSQVHCAWVCFTCGICSTTVWVEHQQTGDACGCQYEGHARVHSFNGRSRARKKMARVEASGREIQRVGRGCG